MTCDKDADELREAALVGLWDAMDALDLMWVYYGVDVEQAKAGIQAVEKLIREQTKQVENVE